MSAGALEIPGRIRRAVARHGVMGALRHAPYLHEEPVWYRLDLGVERDVRPLAEGMTLRPGTPEDIARLPEVLLRVRPDAARARFEVPGTELWLVEEGARPRFACWLFGVRTPVATAPGSWLELPPGVVCLEDSMAAPEIRGRGVAPAVWTRLAAELRGRGCTSMITKVDATNEPSTRAVGKAGFEEILRMDVRRVGPVWRADATVAPQDPLGELLLARLAR